MKENIELLKNAERFLGRKGLKTTEAAKVFGHAWKVKQFVIGKAEKAKPNAAETELIKSAYDVLAGIVIACGHECEEQLKLIGALAEERTRFLEL